MGEHNDKMIYEAFPHCQTNVRGSDGNNKEICFLAFKTHGNYGQSDKNMSNRGVSLLA